jgi:Fic family protein
MDVYELEPCLPPEGDPELGNLAFELVERAVTLAAPINPIVQESLGELVRSMNCYYSNFIEGHETRPRDIDRALHGDFSTNPEQRALQSEARAHIELQKTIDIGEDPPGWPTDESYIRWLHERFCTRLPDELLWIENPDTGERSRVVPGALRDRTVRVGRHIPPPPGDLPAFLHRLEEAFDPKKLSRQQQLVSVGAAHHRLLWIHPFLDGNGRVARLMSHAMLLKLRVGSSLWSIARGLARRANQYRDLLSNADLPRRNALDGRGARSLEGLKEFCTFFLETCIDQVNFMNELLQPSELLRRIALYVDDEVSARHLPKGSFPLLREAFREGEISRGRAPELTGYEERRARQVVSELIDKGLLKSSGHRAPLRLAFPIETHERWLPKLYPADSPTT